MLRQSREKICKINIKIKSLFCFHNLNKTEHFIRSLVGIVRFILEHIVFGLKILAPKLINLETALVYVKMDIALLKIGCAGFPYFRFGMQSLNRMPRAVADAFAMRFGQYKENIQVVMMAKLSHVQPLRDPSTIPKAKPTALCLTVRRSVA